MLHLCCRTTSRPPKWIKPLLTRLVNEASAGNDWLDEITYDGYRMQRAHRCAPVSSMVACPILPKRGSTVDRPCLPGKAPLDLEEAHRNLRISLGQLRVQMGRRCSRRIAGVVGFACPDTLEELGWLHKTLANNAQHMNATAIGWHRRTDLHCRLCPGLAVLGPDDAQGRCLRAMGSNGSPTALGLLQLGPRGQQIIGRIDVMILESKRPTTVITGATGGIGRWIALGMARAGHHVTLIGRDRARGRAAQAWINRNVPRASTELLLADLSLLAETRAVGELIAARHSRISVLSTMRGSLNPDPSRPRKDMTASLRQICCAPSC
jgi:short chain dehydrogenase